ncbi:MAG TPA: hypothetical protein VIP05_19405 [Burkholderiaceae bacterium]
MLSRLIPPLAIALVLAGCDQLGLEPASVTAARVEADGKAVGAACRHGGRAIEDCFTLNKRVDKAAIYAGWREMDDYMRENKLEAVAPTLGAPVKKAEAGDAAPDTATAKADADADKPADKPAVDKPAKAAAAKSDKGGDKAEKLAKADKAGADKPAEH